MIPVYKKINRFYWKHSMALQSTHNLQVRNNWKDITPFIMVRSYQLKERYQREPPFVKIEIFCHCNLTVWLYHLHFTTTAPGDISVSRDAGASLARKDHTTSVSKNGRNLRNQASWTERQWKQSLSRFRNTGPLLMCARIQQWWGMCWLQCNCVINNKGFKKGDRTW